VKVAAGEFANRQLSQNGQSFIPGRLTDCSDWTLDVRNVRNKFAPFARIFAVADSRYIHPAVQITSRIRGSSRTTFLVPSLFPLPSLFLYLYLSFTSAVAIDSAPVSGKRLHSLDQYLQQDSEFRLHAPSDLAGVSRERARDSWPTSGDIHKARTLSEHPDAQSRVYGFNVLYGVAKMTAVCVT